MNFRRQGDGLIYLGAAFLLLATALSATTIRGTVTDPVGIAIMNARVELVSNGKVVSTAATDSRGKYELQVDTSGRFRLRVSAHTFESVEDEAFNNGGRDSITKNILMQPAAISQDIVVTATGMPTSRAQVSSSIDVLGPQEYLDRLDVLNPLLSVPGLQLTQTTGHGGTAQLFIRGGDSNANKVLLDGVPANMIGGDVEFGDLASTGIDRIEVFRGPDSMLYGSDALAGVVDLTTRHGSTPLPEFTYSGDGGTFGAMRHEGSLGGAWRRFDYFADFSHFDTQNNIPNNTLHDGNLVGNFGWSPAAGSNFRVTVRRIGLDLGLPNEIGVYGIPDNANQKNRDTFVSASFDQQTTPKWHNLIRYGMSRLDSKFNNPSPAGIPDGFGDYLGLPMTIQGANGYSVTGQAFFNFADCCPASSISTANRDFAYAQTDYQFTPHLASLFGYRYEAERGFSYFSSPGFTSNSAVDRRNMSFTLEARGDLRNRLFYSLGGGIEKNEVFGVEATPRVGLAYYPFHTGWHFLKSTKLKFNFGKGIKEPSIFDQNSSLYALLQAAGLSSLIQQHNVHPVGAERSRTYDFGVEQAIGDKAVVNITLFHNQFTDGTEFLGTSELISLGVPMDAANQATNVSGGATVNTFSFRSRGIETSLEYKFASDLFARAGYTYLDATVENSFSAVSTFNPAFPNIPIGQFAPLVGARPFRRAPHSGYLSLTYNQPRWSALLQGTFVGRRDDSTFASDSTFGPTLLLPNRNLDGAYQKIDLSGDFRVNPHVSLYASMENLLNQKYDAAFGFPSLPFTIRSGVKLTLGGESWRWK